eukprot:14287406-Alexandrium_andersonii.AAC.1
MRSPRGAGRPDHGMEPKHLSRTRPGTIADAHDWELCRPCLSPRLPIVPHSAWGAHDTAWVTDSLAGARETGRER